MKGDEIEEIERGKEEKGDEEVMNELKEKI